MGTNNFDLIVQELSKQQKIMQELAAEHQALQQQLADFRAGRGIFIEIEGQRFSLADGFSSATPTVAPLVSQERGPQTQVLPEVPETPALAIAEMGTQEVIPVKPKEQPTRPKEQPKRTTTFLEDVMINEFEIASTSPLAVWQGPIAKAEEIDEKQKAELRRELLGSYLLE